MINNIRLSAPIRDAFFEKCEQSRVNPRRAIAVMIANALQQDPEYFDWLGETTPADEFAKHQPEEFDVMTITFKEVV